MSLFSLAFWKFAFERAIKTVAQAGLAAIGANSLGIVAVDWRGIGSVAALAGLVSVLTSLTSFSGGGTVTLPEYIAPMIVTPATVPGAVEPAPLPVVLPEYVAPVAVNTVTPDPAPVPVGA